MIIFLFYSAGPPSSRNRHNSYHKDTLTSQSVVGSLEVIGNTWDTGTHDSVVSSTAQDENNKNAGNELINRGNLKKFYIHNSFFFLYKYFVILKIIPIKL